MKYFYISCFAVLLVFSSCNKEGCTDESATNTKGGAKKDDGSCTYKSTVVFWHTNTTKSVLNSQGTTALVYYLDGTQLGTSDPNIVFSSAPDCSETTAFVRSIAYDQATTKVLSYEVKSQTGQLEFSGTITFTSDGCIAEELAY
jgi:hypothetical protein